MTDFLEIEQKINQIGRLINPQACRAEATPKNTVASAAEALLDGIVSVFCGDGDSDSEEEQEL